MLGEPGRACGRGSQSALDVRAFHVIVSAGKCHFWHCSRHNCLHIRYTLLLCGLELFHEVSRKLASVDTGCFGRYFFLDKQQALLFGGRKPRTLVDSNVLSVSVAVQKGSLPGRLALAATVVRPGSIVLLRGAGALPAVVEEVDLYRAEAWVRLLTPEDLGAALTSLTAWPQGAVCDMCCLPFTGHSRVMTGLGCPCHLHTCCATRFVEACGVCPCCATPVGQTVPWGADRGGLGERARVPLADLNEAWQ